MSRFALILPAAGRSTRFRDMNNKKQFMMMDDRAVWLHAANPFLQLDEVKQIILIISPEDREDFEIRFRANVTILGITVVDGGAERYDSVRNAISAISPECDYVAVHDAVRPCVPAAKIQDVFRVAQKTGAACLAIPVTDTLKRVEETPRSARKEKPSLDNLIPDEPSAAVSDGRILGTVDRRGLWQMQTPQVFRRDLFEKVYAGLTPENSQGVTDDAMLFERVGIPVHVVEGSPRNIKITTREDLSLAAAILKSAPRQKSNFFHPFAD